MTRDEAGEILAGLVVVFPQVPLGTEGVSGYKDALVDFDVRDVTAAAEWCKRNVKWFPSIAELVDATRKARRDRETEEHRREQMMQRDEPRLSREVPTWVLVWSWARDAREPVERRVFPQIAGASDPDTGRPAFLVDPNEPKLSWDDYRKLEEEWREAGEPRVGLVAPLGLRVGEAVKQVPV